MKRIMIISIAMLSVICTNAQTETALVEQYCQVIATPRLLSNKVTIDIDYGNEKSFWRDSRMKTDEGKLKKFYTIIDALNYMGKAGWIFINAYPVRNGTTDIYHFAFKKSFLKNELE